jgi:hypothetical protein
VYVVLWSFEVPAAHRSEFERAYGPAGAWAELFARSAEYRGTELLRDVAQPGRYVTIDRWTGAAALAAFRAQWRSEYEALDRACATLTASETSLGAYEA